MHRLGEAKAKAGFDDFMDDRATAASGSGATDSTPATACRGPRRGPAPGPRRSLNCRPESQQMMYPEPLWGLPDPGIRPEFYADVPTKRLIAWGVDSLLIGLICVLIIPLTGFIALFFLSFLYLAVGFVYRTLTLAAGSATPGMRFMAIRILDRTGERLDFTTASIDFVGTRMTCGEG